MKVQNIAEVFNFLYEAFDSKLFTVARFGAYVPKNRGLMAPIKPICADPEDVPRAVAAESYSASASLSIFGATQISNQGKGNTVIAIAFGRFLISNLRLPERLEKNATLNQGKRCTCYGCGAKGYVY